MQNSPPTEVHLFPAYSQVRMEVDNHSQPRQPNDSDDNDPHIDPHPPPSPPSPSHSPIDSHTIPDSVRGAPEELKPAIRKKQNKESARRSRRRRKELVQNLSNSIAMLVEKTQELETRLDCMERYLSKSGFEAFSQPRLQYPALGPRSVHSSDAGASHSGSVVLGSDGSQTKGQSGAQSAGRRELDDEDVEKLIASCLEQL